MGYESAFLNGTDLFQKVNHEPVILCDGRSDFLVSQISRKVYPNFDCRYSVFVSEKATLEVEMRLADSRIEMIADEKADQFIVSVDPEVAGFPLHEVVDKFRDCSGTMIEKEAWLMFDPLENYR